VIGPWYDGVHMTREGYVADLARFEALPASEPARATLVEQCRAELAGFDEARARADAERAQERR
jgi:hypothetical protein